MFFAFFRIINTSALHHSKVKGTAQLAASRGVLQSEQNLLANQISREKNPSLKLLEFCFSAKEW